MRRVLVTTALLSLIPAAHAAESQQWGALRVTLESCFRASSGTDSGCNVILTNTSDKPLSVNLDSDRDTVSTDGQLATEPKELILGGLSHPYSVQQIIPAGLSMRAQLNYNVTKGVRTLAQVHVGDALFTNVPLQANLPDEPDVNAPGTPVTADANDQARVTFLDCLRKASVVTCSFAVANLTDENLRFNAESSDDTWLLTNRGLVRTANDVTLAGETHPYSVSAMVPARRQLLNQLTFTLPETDTRVPYLQVNGFVFRSLPIAAAPGNRALNAAGDLVDTYRLRDYAGKIDRCTYVRDGLRCDFTLTNRTDAAYRLNIDSDDVNLLTTDGRWFGVKSLTAGGETRSYSAAVPLATNRPGTLSVLFDAPAGLTTLPFVNIGALEFENVPVR